MKIDFWMSENEKMFQMVQLLSLMCKLQQCHCVLHVQFLVLSEYKIFKCVLYNKTRIISQNYILVGIMKKLLSSHLLQIKVRIVRYN